MKTTVVYKAAPGAPFPKKAAPIIGRHLEKLERVSGGGITPAAVVTDASRRGSPLHPYFCWDDTEAAEKYRLHQARLLINHLIVIVETKKGERSLKGFHSVRVGVGDDRPERSYASLATVDNDPVLREQVIRQAVRELEYWQSRYGQLRELWAVNRAINKAKGRGARGSRRRAGAT